MLWQIIGALLAGYLLGSIPSGYLVGMAWGVDVRKHGSGRTGGTNVWRATRQALPPILTILADVLKGVVAVMVGRYLFGSELAAALAGAGAVFGHNWSCFLRFRGGAGGMTTGATLLALTPLAGAIAIPLALLVLAVTRYASAASLTMAVGSLVALILMSALTNGAYPWVHVVFGVLATAGVTWALRPNLARLIRGEETRIGHH